MLYYLYLNLTLFYFLSGIYNMKLKTHLMITAVSCVLYFSFCIVSSGFVVLILFCGVKGRYIKLYYQEAKICGMRGSGLHQFQLGFKLVGKHVKESSKIGSMSYTWMWTACEYCAPVYYIKYSHTYII